MIPREKEMASMKMAENRYSGLEKEELELDLDLENDSDTTLASSGFLEKSAPKKRSSRKSRISKIQIALTWLRWVLVVVLQSVILVLLLRNPSASSTTWSKDDTETGGDVNGLYKPSASSPPALHLTIELILNSIPPLVTLNVRRVQIRPEHDDQFEPDGGTA